MFLEYDYDAAKDFRIDPEFKAAWVAALRSGNYKQGYGQLKQRSTNQASKYCCLGVAMEVLIERGTPGVTTLGDGFCSHPSGVANVGAPDDQAGMLMGWPGAGSNFFSVYMPVRDVGWSSASLINFNDVDHLTFDQIADVVDYFL